MKRYFEWHFIIATSPIFFSIRRQKKNAILFDDFNFFQTKNIKKIKNKILNL